MELTKIRSLSDEELKTQETQVADQLFRIRFQSKLGQNDGVKKIRELRKDIARMQTIARERALGIERTEISASTKAVAKAGAKTRSGKGAK